jgi:hypothetical protein
MVLGDLIRTLSDGGAAAEALIACGDLTLAVRVEDTAARFGEAMGDYAGGAVRRFANMADDEDWLALVTALERADEPGHACLRHMLEWALAQDMRDPSPEPTGCGCGGGCH